MLCDVIGRSHLWLQPLMWRSETGTTSTAVRSRRCSNDCTAPSLYNMSATRNNIDCKHVFIKCFKSPDTVLNGLIHIFILVLSFVSWVSPLDQFSFFMFCSRVFKQQREPILYIFCHSCREYLVIIFGPHRPAVTLSHLNLSELEPSIFFNIKSVNPT